MGIAFQTYDFSILQCLMNYIEDKMSVYDLPSIDEIVLDKYKKMKKRR